MQIANQQMHTKLQYCDMQPLALEFRRFDMIAQIQMTKRKIRLGIGSASGLRRNAVRLAQYRSISENAANDSLVDSPVLN
jgi:hypothetical protein